MKIKVILIQLVYRIMLCFYQQKHYLIKRNCKFGKTHQNLIQEFSRVYVHEDKFDYNIYKYLASSRCFFTNMKKFLKANK